MIFNREVPLKNKFNNSKQESQTKLKRQNVIRLIFKLSKMKEISSHKVHQNWQKSRRQVQPFSDLNCSLISVHNSLKQNLLFSLQIFHQSMVWGTNLTMALTVYCSMIKQKSLHIQICSTLITLINQNKSKRLNHAKMKILQKQFLSITYMSTLKVLIRKSFYSNTSRDILMETKS